MWEFQSVQVSQSPKLQEFENSKICKSHDLSEVGILDNLQTSKLESLKISVIIRNFRNFYISQEQFQNSCVSRLENFRLLNNLQIFAVFYIFHFTND